MKKSLYGETEKTNTGRLCSVWRPECGRVTEKISFNLIGEAKSVKTLEYLPDEHRDYVRAALGKAAGS
ncbi:MAG: hypothetical protein LBF78_02985 [Treponema sp.]|jgi:hypothetical protein|nr:hypothetical protein [Treponema sp.]